MTAFVWRATLAALVSTCLVPAAASQVFRSGVEIVRLDVSATRGSAPVAGLSARDFIVTDNGVEQDIESTQLDRVPLRIQVAFDVSGSVAGRRLQALQGALGRLLDELDPGDRVGVLTFSNHLRVRAPMSEDIAAARASLAGIVPEGPTALRDAVALGVTLAAGPEARGLLLLFTDGDDNASWVSAEGALDVAKRTDAIVHVVRVGTTQMFPSLEREPVGAGFIDRLVEATGGREWRASSDNDLARLATAAFGEVRARYLLTYQPKEPHRPGWHEVKVRLRDGRATAKTRPGYIVAP